MLALKVTSKPSMPHANAIGFVCALGAVASRAALHPVLENTLVWLTFWPATVIAAKMGGLRSALVCTVLSVIAVTLWVAVAQPVYPREEQLAVSGFVFAVCGFAFGRVGEALWRSRAETIAANQAKDRFLAMLGHELRNPLAPIRTATQLLQRRGHRSRELDVIDRQTTHMTLLVDDLLDLSRITRGRLELRPEVIELGAVVDRATEMVVRDRKIDVDLEPGLYVHADPSRLVQVVSNLLHNAIKFSGPADRIDVIGARQGDRVVLRVIDRGIGMTGDLLARAFEPFAQADQAIDRASGGLGLGLAIAKQLVELHHGTITAHSEGEGRGSELRVELPAHEAVATEVSSEPSPGSGRRERIVVVDDNADIAQLLADGLEAEGHDVAVAFDGPTALELAASHQPTVMLLDIGLPGMDGLHVARELRRRGAGVRLVALSGYGQPSDRARARDAGFDDYLVKPVSLASVERAIREAQR